MKGIDLTKSRTMFHSNRTNPNPVHSRAYARSRNTYALLEAKKKAELQSAYEKAIMYLQMAYEYYETAPYYELLWECPADPSIKFYAEVKLGNNGTYLEVLQEVGETCKETIHSQMEQQRLTALFNQEIAANKHAYRNFEDDYTDSDHYLKTTGYNFLAN
jgi:hypothetical protein